jgi:putative molybdopterin biosynthesis protein
VRLTSREIGVLAPSAAPTSSSIVAARRHLLDRQRDRGAGLPLRPGAVYDSNAAIIGAAVEELGGRPFISASSGRREALASALARGLQCDLVIFSGGTSKGEAISRTVWWAAADPGVVVHGVALKPGKPICLAVTGGKPVVILPGFPTSAIFTFHEFVAPVIRAFAGCRSTARSRCRDASDARELRAGTNRVPAGRPGAGTAGTHRVSDGQGIRARSPRSAARTASSPSTSMPRSSMPAARFRPALGRDLEPADLVIIGSHCVGLDLLDRQADAPGLRAKIALRRKHGRARGGEARRMRHRGHSPAGPAPANTTVRC